MKYKALYSDFHTNIHHIQIDELEKWYEHARKTLDFWLIAYYPFEKYSFGKGLKSERALPEDLMYKDWAIIRKFVNNVNATNPDFPMFLGYEWQGSGEDGDHNVFFKEDGMISTPLRYQELRDNYRDQEVIAIPHHLAYSKGHRGKNWSTHDDEFSPLAEIKSQHGSSEYGITDIKMDRHIHMGPRTGGTSVFDGLNLGNKFGIIAAGDNHVVPADQINGIAGVWAEDNSKDAIWDAIKNRRTFGCTDNRIKLWFDIEDTPMGGTVKSTSKSQKANVKVIANSKVKHVELIHNGDLVDVHINKEQKKRKNTKFKSKIEFGWGPNPEVYPEIVKRDWNIILETDSKILSMEPSFSNFDHEIVNKTEHSVEFNMTTYKTSHSGKWMGKAPIVSEGYIFEFKGSEDDNLTITINGKEYKRTMKSLFDNTDLIVELDEAYKIAEEYYDFKENYRSDAFYHNAYKTRINEAFSENQYNLNMDFNIDEKDQNGWYLVKVYQQDGQIAWSSPIWFE